MKQIIDKTETGKIKQSLLKKRNGVQKYIEIMEEIKKSDGHISQNKDFQNKYKNFYKMHLSRSLTEDFYNEYFKYLEKNYKNKQIEFKDVLEYISNKSNRIEASFSSKLLATINPDRVVWDKNVRSQLEIPNAKSFNDAIKLYDELETKLKNIYLNTDLGKEYIRIFNETFENILPIEEITPIKKIDFVLWSLGEKNV